MGASIPLSMCLPKEISLSNLTEVLDLVTSCPKDPCSLCKATFNEEIFSL